MDTDFKRFTGKPTLLCVKCYISKEPRLQGVLTEALTQPGVQQELCWVLKDAQEFPGWQHGGEGVGRKGYGLAAQRVGRGLIRLGR